MKERRFTEAQDMGVLRQAEGGMPVPVSDHGYAVSGASYYKWRPKYGGMGASMMSQRKALGDENRRLKRMFAGLSMRTCFASLPENVTRPAQRRELAAKAVVKVGSIALACRAFGSSATCFCYRLTRGEEKARIADLLAGLTNAHKTWRFGLCSQLPRNMKGRAVVRDWFKPKGEGLGPQSGPSYLLRAGAEPADQIGPKAEVGQAGETGRAGCAEYAPVHGRHGGSTDGNFGF